MGKSERKFISIYFEDGHLNCRKKRDVTIAFSDDELLFLKCKSFGSAKIKKIIGIKSYKTLLSTALKEGRSISNLIKHRLNRSLKKQNK